jgi:hypothetical protein
MRIIPFFGACLLLAAPAFAQTSSETVSQWAQHAVPTILEINPQAFDAQKESNRPLFTKQGHEEFYKAMKQARIRESMEARGQTAKVRKMCVTDIAARGGKLNEWVVQSEILYDYSDSLRTRTDKQKVTVVIEESTKNGAPKFAIMQYIAQPAGDGFQCTDNTAAAADPHAARKDEIRRQIRALADELRTLDGGSEADLLR